MEDNLPSPDAKATYHDVIVNVMQVKEDQTMYYLANPDGGKKVEPRDGRYWCEAESRFVDVAENRYVLTARIADATQECYVNMFNEQVRGSSDSRQRPLIVLKAVALEPQHMQ